MTLDDRLKLIIEDIRNAEDRPLRADELTFEEQIKRAVLESLLSEQFHGSSCIDSDCEDEDHGYYAVAVDSIKEILG